MNYIRESITFTTAIITLIYLYFGVYVLKLNRRDQLHRIFFYMTLALSFWSFCAFWAYNANSMNCIRKWVKVGFIAQSLFYALILHFAIRINNPEKRLFLLTQLIYLPVLYFIYMNFKSYVLYEDFEVINGVWVLKLGSDLARSYSFIIYENAYLVVSIILLIIKYLEAKLYRKKMQSKILAISLFASFTIATVENVIFPEMTSYNSTQITMVIYLIWVMGIWYAMVKYRFLKISPAVVSKDMINNILEAVILLDDKLRIISVNSKLKELIKKEDNDLIYHNISDIIEEHRSVTEEIEKNNNKNLFSFSSRIHFKTGDEKQILMDVRISSVNDKFGDRIGYMIIGSEIKDLKRFKLLHGITAREVEIIQGIISGLSNKEIALNLNISEHTVKTHISHIFNKLGLDNRMQLLSFLKDFDLSPDHKADKSVFLIKNR